MRSIRLKFRDQFEFCALLRTNFIQMAHSTPLNYLWASVLCYFKWNPYSAAHRMPSKWNINNLEILFSYHFTEVLFVPRLCSFVCLFVFFLTVMNRNQTLITMTKSSLASFSELFFFAIDFSFAPCFSLIFTSTHRDIRQIFEYKIRFFFYYHALFIAFFLSLSLLSFKPLTNFVWIL